MIQIKLKRNLIILLVIVQLIAIVSPVMAAPHNFGISSVEDMPDAGCGSKYDDLFYYGGIAAGVDPVMLKVISRRETSCGTNIKISPNKNSAGVTTSYDSGLMQINSGGFGQLVLDSNDTRLNGDSAEDREKLNKDDIMGVWAATEVLKWKATSVHNMVRGAKKIKGTDRLATPDAFNLLLAYNSYSSAGMEYANEVHSWYLENTRLAKMPSGDVNYRDAVYDVANMNYEDFAKRLEDASEGKITVENYVPRTSWGDEGSSEGSDDVEWIKEDSRDDSPGTGLVGEKTQTEVVINYKVYRFVKNIIKVINFVIQILAYVALVVLLLMWAAYVVAKAGFIYIEAQLDSFTNGKVVASDDGSLNVMLVITFVTLLIISLILTGFLMSLVERAIIAFVSAIQKAF